MNNENLLQNRQLLEKQIFWLKHSINEARKIGLKERYSVAEFDIYENLCSRFARMIDFLVRKVYRSIDDAEFEAQGTLIDVVNRAHKRSLFDDIVTVHRIKDLRNAIAHEYVDDGLQQLFGEVVELAPILLQMAEKSMEYTKRFV